MLTRNEVIELLKAVTAGRSRTIGEPDITMWRAALTAGGVTTLPDAMQAVVEFYAESTDWIMPAHVVQRVKAIRAKRREAEPPISQLMAGVSPDLAGVDYCRELAARRHAIADGRIILTPVTS